jgi:hypothetical protein
MSTNEIIDEVMADVMSEEGILMQIRLGKLPDTVSLYRLRSALRALYRKTAANELLDRRLIFVCTHIIRVANECVENLGESSQRVEIIDAVRDLVQGAYEVLNGDFADRWISRRPDLEFCSHDANGQMHWHRRLDSNPKQS